jgi:hypothetical protein
MTSSRSQINARRAIAIGLVITVASSGITWWLGTKVKSPAQAAVNDRPESSVITASVEQRVLRQLLVVQGTVKPQREIEVEVEAAGEGIRPVITKTPLRLGSRVTEGSVLIEVSGRPVLVFRGRIPMYRTLRVGSEGQDVRQLQAALSRLGYYSGAHNGHFSRTTAVALENLYRAKGYDPPTSIVADEDADGLSFNQDAAWAGVHSQNFSDRLLALGSSAQVSPNTPTTTPKTTTSSAPVPSTPTPPATSPPVVPPSTTTVPPAPRTQLTIPYAEIAFIERLPARVTEMNAEVGQKPVGTLVRVADGPFVIESTVTAEEAELIRSDDGARVDAEILGQRFRARIAGVTPLSAGQEGGDAQDGTPATEDESNPDSGSEFSATFTGLQEIDSNLRGHDARVTVEIASTGRKVLVVPVSALWTSADGISHVTKMDGRGATGHVSVEAGMSADGFVAVRPVKGSLEIGSLVVIGSEPQDG